MDSRDYEVRFVPELGLRVMHRGPNGCDGGVAIPKKTFPMSLEYVINQVKIHDIACGIARDARRQRYENGRYDG